MLSCRHMVLKSQTVCDRLYNVKLDVDMLQINVEHDHVVVHQSYPGVSSNF